jgi:hypothetical protein
MVQNQSVVSQQHLKAREGGSETAALGSIEHIAAVSPFSWNDETQKCGFRASGDATALI